MRRFGRFVSLLILPLIFEIVYSALKSLILNKPPIWSFEISLFLYGCFFMLGSAYCHMDKKHVEVDIILHYLPPKGKRLQRIFSEGVVLFVALVMLWVSIPAAWRATLIEERSTHQTPFNPEVWWYRWIIPFSCALLSAQALKDMMIAILKRPSRTPEIREPGQ